MARIPESFVQDLLNRLDIVEVVERYLPLKKAGQNYAACCPFHNEKSPSFTVSQTKQFYHCFGCGAHGSAIGFVMEFEGLGFPDTVEKLAESVGMAVPKADNEVDSAPKRAQQSSLVELNTRAMHYYRAQLKASPRAVDYLKRRGLSGQIAARFGLGYAPDSWHPLAECFSDYATNKQLPEVGLVIDHADTNRRYDRFRDRIVFPIMDGKSQVIGFGGRIIDQGEPKYLNSPETPLFQKGLELYGLPQARQAIRSQNRVLVVEGYMDVVALAQLGVEYAVATLGTACTPEHIKKLMRLADQVVFSFDGDRAGRKAAWRALENSLALANDGKTLSFLFLPAEHDPDSYIREFGKAAFEALIESDALGLVAFICKELASQVDMDSDEGKARFLHAAKPYVEQIKAPAIAVLLRKRLAELTGLDSHEAAAILGATPLPIAAASTTEPAFHPQAREAKAKPRQARPPQWTATPPTRSGSDLGFELLQLLVNAPSYALQVPQNELAAFQLTAAQRALLRVVDFVNEQADVPTTGHLLEGLRHDPCYGLLLQAFEKGDATYRDGDNAIFKDTWEHALERYLLQLEKPKAARRQAELEAKGFANLSAEEKAEFGRLAMLGRES